MFAKASLDAAAIVVRSRQVIRCVAMCRSASLSSLPSCVTRVYPALASIELWAGLPFSPCAFSFPDTMLCSHDLLTQSFIWMSFDVCRSHKDSGTASLPALLSSKMPQSTPDSAPQSSLQLSQPSKSTVPPVDSARTFLAIKKLGSGGYSDVFLGHDQKDKEYESTGDARLIHLQVEGCTEDLDTTRCSPAPERVRHPPGVGSASPSYRAHQRVCLSSHLHNTDMPQIQDLGWQACHDP